MDRLRTLRGPALVRFTRHYVEMVVAMLLGMMLLGPLESLLLAPVGWADLRDQPEFDALIMATNMTVAMVAWMRFRGHSWAPCAEMAAVMYVSFLILFPPLWFGVLPPSGMLVGGHVLMFTAMIGAMLWRLEEYAGHHHPATT